FYGEETFDAVIIPDFVGYGGLRWSGHVWLSPAGWGCVEKGPNDTGPLRARVEKDNKTIYKTWFPIYYVRV
ncbi:MAG: hypothetical protein WD994_03990, partial [Pseudomonadales bacterium]